MKEIKIRDKVRLKSLDELEEHFDYVDEIGEFANEIVTITDKVLGPRFIEIQTRELGKYVIYKSMIAEIVEDDDYITKEELNKELESFKEDIQKSVAECLHGFRENFNYSMSGGIFGSLTSEKKYVWRLKGFNGKNDYLNLIDNKNSILISSEEDFSYYRTQFTEKEFMDLAEKYGFITEAFEKVEVEE